MLYRSYMFLSTTLLNVYGAINAICDLVHDEETIFHLSYVLTASGNLF